MGATVPSEYDALAVNCNGASPIFSVGLAGEITIDMTVGAGVGEGTTLEPPPPQAPSNPTTASTGRAKIDLSKFFIC